MYGKPERMCNFNEVLGQHIKHFFKVTKQNPNQQLHILQTKWEIGALQLVTEANRFCMTMGVLRNASVVWLVECAMHS